MTKLLLTTALAAIATVALAVPSASAAGTVPCEDMLKDLRSAVAKASLSEADKAKVTTLEDKGIERCNADDDKRADSFFAQALQLVGK